MWLNSQAGSGGAASGPPRAARAGGEPSGFGGPKRGTIGAWPMRPPDRLSQPSTLPLK
jgi:hypothetical protein